MRQHLGTAPSRAHERRGQRQEHAGTHLTRPVATCERNHIVSASSAAVTARSERRTAALVERRPTLEGGGGERTLMSAGLDTRCRDCTGSEGPGTRTQGRAEHLWCTTRASGARDIRAGAPACRRTADEEGRDEVSGQVHRHTRPASIAERGWRRREGTEEGSPLEAGAATAAVPAAGARE